MTTPTPLVIVGAGGHGREAYVTIEALNRVRPTFDVLGFVDDDPAHPERVERLGTRIVGDLDWLEAHPQPFVLGIGDPTTRRAVAGRLASCGEPCPTVVHPGARLGPDVQLGQGVLVFDRCTITTNVRVGEHTHFNVGCAAQHDTRIGAFSQLSPGVLVNGDCTVGDSVFLGTGAVLTRGVSVGPNARVGAGAVVLHDVEAGATVVGVPARRTDR